MTDPLPALIAAGRAASDGALDEPCMASVEGSCYVSYPHARHVAAHPPAMTRALWDAVEALAALHADNLDYIRLNKLSGAENNHVMRLAEAALARLRALAEAGR